MNQRQHRWAILVLFLLASVHCTRSIFVDNVSLLDLQRYEQGLERTPFQSRVAMIPVLRWAHNNHALTRAAAFLDGSLRRTPHFSTPPEDWTPEKVACLLLGTVAVLAAVAAGIRYGDRHFRTLWWLPSALMLPMLYTANAARSEMQFWYPYDLPHFAIFGLAALCLLEDRPLPMLFLFMLDTPVRETSIYLIPLTLAMGFDRGQQRRAIITAAGMLAFWLPIHYAIARRFAANPSDTNISLLAVGRAVGNPLHWPQIASAFGFLLLPLLMSWRYLTRSQRSFLLGAAPCAVITLLFGIWYETRIWNEWILPVSVLAASAFVKRYALSTDTSMEERVLTHKPLTG